MKKNLLFLGNDGSLIKKIAKLENINLVGVVGDEVSYNERKFFGSSVLIGKKLNIPLISQSDFKRKTHDYLKGVFRNSDIIFIHGYRFKIDGSLCRDKNIKIVNFHQSLLPNYGGRHPLNWAIINAEKSTGITFHYINERFDAGDIILQKKIAIAKNDTINDLYRKTISRGCKELGKVLNRIFDEKFVPNKQDASKRRYYRPRRPEDGEILKNDTVEKIRNKIRALQSPYPGAFIYVNNRKIIIDTFRLINTRHSNNFVSMVNGELLIKAKDGLIKVTRIRKKA